jgi:hypothetical protein
MGRRTIIRNPATTINPASEEALVPRLPDAAASAISELGVRGVVTTQTNLPLTKPGAVGPVARFDE